MMNVFEVVRESVTAREVAEYYGIHVRRNGMACCPFHDDRTPSMKLDKRFHCFGCQADGDAIDFVARYFGIRVKEAAIRIADDFCLPYELPGKTKKWTHISDGASGKLQRKYLLAASKNEKRKELHEAELFLKLYLDCMREWAHLYAPKHMGDSWHPYFVESMQRTDQVIYLMEVISECRDSEIDNVLEFMKGEMTRIHERLKKIDGK